MKKNLPDCRRHLVILAVSVLLSPLVPAQTIDDYVVDQFADDTGVLSWSTAWGIAPTFEWDPAENSTVTANPEGAMKVTVNFDLATLQGDNQTAFQRPFADVIDFELYKNIHFDMKVDDSSSRLSTSWGAGQFGGINLIARTSDWSVQLEGITTSDPWLGVEDYGVWRHFSTSVDQTLLNHHNMGALMFHIWSGWVEADGVSGGHAGPVTFWLDNLFFEKNTNTVETPPPSLALGPGTSGLHLIASLSGSQYQRQSIRTVEGAHSWVGRGGPVTYELTIKEAPLKNGFQAHFFLIPNSTGDNAPDWNRPDALLVRVSDLGDGRGEMAVGFKTGEPNGNSQIFGANQLATLACGQIVGTWKVTFNNDTDLTLTAPDGGSTNAVMNATAASVFADPLTLYVGSQPNETDWVGSGFVISNVKATGVASPINDSFSGPELNSQVWAVAADNAAGVFIAPGDARYWLKWTLPAAGFDPQVTGALQSGTWNDLDPAACRKLGDAMALMIGTSDLPGGNQAFFRLTRRAFTKLQILLPGESAAPGTPTGKTGTPTPQVAGVPFDVVVNAVDDTWHLAVIGRDSVALTSSDSSASLPAEAALAGGTRTFSVTLFDVGSFTVTATDVTDATKSAVTSSPVTVE